MALITIPPEFGKGGSNLDEGTPTLREILANHSQEIEAKQDVITEGSTTGQTSGFTAGSGAHVLVDSVFTGGTGTKAYTIGDLVKHLKAAGIIAAS